MREGSRTGVTRNSPDDFLTEGNAVCLFVCKLFGLFSETIASCPPTQNTVMVMILCHMYSSSTDYRVVVDIVL